MIQVSFFKEKLCKSITVLKYMMACLQHLGVSSGCKGTRGLVDRRDGIDGMEQIVTIFYCMILVKFKLIYEYLWPVY